MSENSWAVIADLVAGAIELPPEERAAFLDARCGADTAMRREVESLLAHAISDGPLDRPPLAAAKSEPSPQRFGPYRVVGVLGRGGMGAVYLAERDDGQFQRKVAVKRVAGADSQSALRRFESEREILGALSHPNIAHLEDAGIAEDGSPYLVMEHVEGEPLTDFCRTLPLPARLRLFIKVTRAVQFAHQNLVVHRDLKPSNILVTAEGTPKLLDFGIAKLLPDGAPDVTVTMIPILTPAYASPEQICAERVTTSSDVYSLGVLLYEVVGETRPYDLTGKTLPEILRLVCEHRPAPLPASIPSDLQSVVAKAMARRPEERYGSAGDLATDLANFLGGRPVAAKPPSRGYLLRKFVVRHRKSVGASVLTLLALAASAGYAWRERQTAVAARQRAELHFQAVRSLANAVLDEFTDKAAAIPGSLELRRLMAQRTLESMDALARNAGDDNRLLSDVAEAYMRLGDLLGNPSVANLGDRAGARGAYAKAAAILEPLTSRHPDQLDFAIKLGALLAKQASLQKMTGDEEGARATSARALALWESLVRRFPGSTEARNGLAGAHFHVAGSALTSAEKKQHYNRALELYRQQMALKSDDWNAVRNVALMHKYLGGIYEDTEPAEILRHLMAAEELDSMRVKANPQDQSARLDHSFDLSMIGTYYSRQADHAKAAEYFEQVVAIRRQLWEDEPKNDRARNRYFYATLISASTQMENGNQRLAISRCREVLQKIEAIPAFGDDVSLKSMAESARLDLPYYLAGKIPPPRDLR
jgi:non-specific serine/threonine protein kinase/serine/threonine-protein kinase